MTIGHYAKNLKLVERNKEWLGSPISPSHKLGYYPHLVLSYVNLLANKVKHIKYLGEKFYYDNPATPLNLQNYPHEIAYKILRFLPEKPEYVLDVGANLGQFARTMSALAGDDCKIDSFEPNPLVFELLKKNASEAIRPHLLALGDEVGELSFYFEENRSGIGSFFKDNAGNADKVKSIKVKVTDDASKATGRTNYDLVKVDVEGFEYQALQGLKNITTKYLYIEASGAGRSRSYSDAGLIELIKNNFGDFDILYHSKFQSGEPTYEMLLRFKG